jgi:hypothetical protein
MRIKFLPRNTVGSICGESLCHYSLDGKVYYADQISTAVALQGLPPKYGMPRHQPKRNIQ